ncbi:MBG domain-containing protein [Algoriphagus sp. AK58]|uniref:MBG domain-containing protein n=1 Tax=Algoriphagus sp. AK58 TaxID=1406877 RepID=UPI001650B4BB|nr:MBG domain-containing protein [Algoriphagus sp. AK58]MBC6368796.1 hypothetical protein [Algoriphagus sp. AK58]
MRPFFENRLGYFDSKDSKGVLMSWVKLLISDFLYVLRMVIRVFVDRIVLKEKYIYIKYIISCVVLFSFISTSFGQYAGGNGTKENPFQIKNWVHLKNIALNPQASFVLVSSLDHTTEGYQEFAGPTANNGKGWVALMNFRGRFNGNGLAISDLYIKRTTQRGQALFGSAQNADLRNIHLRDAYIEAFEDAGSLVGVGVNIKVEGCSFSGIVSGSTYVGGLLGTISNSLIMDSYSLGTVKGQKMVGGLIGNAYQTHVSRSFSSGEIISDSSVGGLIGFFQSNAYHRIESCYSVAKLEALETIGGLVARISGGQIDNSYFAGSVPESALSGGLVGLVVGKTKALESFWVKSSVPSATNTDVGFGTTSSELKSAQYFKDKNWDFEGVWNIQKPSVDFPFVSYPYLKSIAYDDPASQAPVVNPIPGLENFRVPREHEFPKEKSVTYGDPDFKLGEEIDPSYYPITYSTKDTTVIKISGNYAKILQSGTATILAQVEDGNSNPKEQLLTVYPAILRIKTDQNLFKTYGDQDPMLSFQVEGLKYNDGQEVVKGTPVREEGEQVGEYAVFQGSLEAGSNYLIEFTASLFEILKKELLVQAEGKEKCYGKSDPDLTFKVTGLVPNDLEKEIIKGSLKREPGENVGKYAIISDDLQVGENYHLVFTSDTMEILPSLIISMREFEEVTIPWSVLPDLPKKATFLTQDGDWVELALEWDASKVQTMKRGKYEVEGKIQTSNYLFPSDFKPFITVVVLPKPAPQDLILHTSLSAESFIGELEVIDPIDTIHDIRIPEGVLDNTFFQLKGKDLSWKNGAFPKSKKGFDLEIQVEDRDGNVLTKRFSIQAQIASNSEVEMQVVNTFSPNGDGVNDSWIPSKNLSGEDFRVRVYDTSGKELFQSECTDDKWDGTYLGQEVPEGTYFWVLETRGKVRRGVLNLLRGN